MGCDDRGTESARAGGRMRRSPSGAVMVIDLCRERELQATNTGGTMIVVSDEYDFGPSIEDIVIHAEARDRETNFTYKVGFQYKFEDGDWTTVVVLDDGAGAGIDDTDYHISSAYSTRTSFGMKIRFVVQTLLPAGQSGTAVARLNVSAAVRFFT